MRHAERDRALKPSTLRGYRSIVSAYLLPAFGERRLEDITSEEIERWRAELAGRQRALSNASKSRILTLLHGILRRACKVHRLPINAAACVERHRVRSSGDIDVFSPEEVWALVRAAASDQDAAIFLAAAFTGMRRGELLALRWRDLRHTFGTRMIAKADIRRVQEWMGHADVQTTMRYLHFAPREEDARLVAEAFELKRVPAPRNESGRAGAA
jgi:integrase